MPQVFPFRAFHHPHIAAAAILAAARQSQSASLRSTDRTRPLCMLHENPFEAYTHHAGGSVRDTTGAAVGETVVQRA